MIHGSLLPHPRLRVTPFAVCTTVPDTGLSRAAVNCHSDVPCRRRRFGPSFSAKSHIDKKRVRRIPGVTSAYLLTRSIFQPDSSPVLSPFLAPFADGPRPRYPTLAR